MPVIGFFGSESPQLFAGHCAPSARACFSAWRLTWSKIIVDVSPAEIRQAMSRPPGHD